MIIRILDLLVSLGLTFIITFGLAFFRQSLPVFYAIFVPTAAAPFCMPEAGPPH
jgi:hypothetical protein